MSLIIIGFAMWAITETYREWKKKHGYIPKYQKQEFDLQPIEEHIPDNVLPTLKYF